MSGTMKRLRGLGALLQDAVEHGASAVERVHKATADRPFAILDRIPPLSIPARGVHAVHDATVSGVYETIRQVNRFVGVAVSFAIDVAEELEAERMDAPDKADRSEGG